MVRPSPTAGSQNAGSRWGYKQRIWSRLQAVEGSYEEVSLSTRKVRREAQGRDGESIPGRENNPLQTLKGGGLIHYSFFRSFSGLFSKWPANSSPEKKWFIYSIVLYKCAHFKAPTLTLLKLFNSSVIY